MIEGGCRELVVMQFIAYYQILIFSIVVIIAACKVIALLPSKLTFSFCCLASKFSESLPAIQFHFLSNLFLNL